MSNPAVEAAQRAWAERYPNGSVSLAVSAHEDGLGAFVVAASREALKPIRELHRKSPMFDLADDCDICSSEDDKVSEQHATVESANGDWLCTANAAGHCCRHCSGIRRDDGDPVEWPCETAWLVYPTEELER
jgi:hypothetical protein